MSASPPGSEPPPATADIGTLELVEYPHPALFRKAQPLVIY